MLNTLKESAAALVLGAGATQVPGPTKDEWTGVILGVLMLGFRELLAFINRRRGA